MKQRPKEEIKPSFIWNIQTILLCKEHEIVFDEKLGYNVGRCQTNRAPSHLPAATLASLDISIAPNTIITLTV